MRILIVDTYYPAFLRDIYAQQPGLSERPYAEQWRALMDQCFGTADFYSANLAALGHEATDIIANAEPLQQQWARERGLALPPPKTRLTLTRRRGVIPWLSRVPDDAQFYAVLKAQVAEFRPDVLYIQDMHALRADFLREIKPHVRLTVGQIASPVPQGADYRPYDLVLTSLPHFVVRFRRQGLHSEYFRLGFEPRVLDHIGPPGNGPVAFVGGLTAAHPERIALLEAVATTFGLDFWGYGMERLSPASPLRRSYRGAAWGLSMYQALRNASMTLNHHSAVAEGHANNMRLYEATGVGTLLLTDTKDDLARLFEPGQEVITYRSADECLEQIAHFQSHPDARREIANAGQKRTLAEHTYCRRMQELLEILGRLL